MALGPRLKIFGGVFLSMVGQGSNYPAISGQGSGPAAGDRQDLRSEA